MPDESVKDGPPSRPPAETQAEEPDHPEPVEAVAEVLAEVHEAVATVKGGGLQEAVEAAIETIDSVSGGVEGAMGQELNGVADALEAVSER
jgi:hypothetical protein